MVTTEQPLILRAVDAQHGTARSFDDEGRDWLLLGLTPEANQRIEELAQRTGDTKADLINKALGLYKAASDAHYNGLKVIILDEKQELETEFVGF